MKKLSKDIVYPVLSMIMLVFLNLGCEKDDSDVNKINGRTSANFNSALSYGSMTDQEGNTYKTIKIGSQTWMAENLRTRKYRNGDRISHVNDNVTWREANYGAYCNYNNTGDLDTIATYGRLYNGFVIDDYRQIAPEGWRVPSNDDWNELISFLGGGDMLKGDSIGGAFLKEAGYQHWRYFSYHMPPVDNSSGFTAIPAGWRAADGFGVDQLAFFWSSTQTEWGLWFVNLIDAYPKVDKRGFGGVKALGMSIRCVKE